jgi:hypothetical protein
MKKTHPESLTPLISPSSIAGADHGQASKQDVFRIDTQIADRTALAGAAFA